MAIGNFPLYSLNSGEVSRLALARVDVAKMRMSSQVQMNWTPWVIGPMSLRPGLMHIGEVFADNPSRMIPFIYAKDDSALVECSSNEMRVWIDDVLLSRPQVITAISDPYFVGGGTWDVSTSTGGNTATVGGGKLSLASSVVGGVARATQTVAVLDGDKNTEHGVRIVVDRGPVEFKIGTADTLDDIMSTTTLDTGVHSLSFTPGVTSIVVQIATPEAPLRYVTECAIEPVGPVVIPTSWGSGDIGNLRWDQSQDIIYVACAGQSPRKIERRGTRPHARGWSFVLYKTTNGPLQSQPSVTANLTPSVSYGNGYMVSDVAYFKPGHVGAIFRLFNQGQQNAIELGGENQYTKTVRVTGVGDQARNYSWDVSGTYVGELTLQRSLDSAEGGFADVTTGTDGQTGTGILPSQTGGSGGTPDLDNVIAWERLGFKSGNYTSGFATISSQYTGGGYYGICRVVDYVSPTQVNIEILSPFSSGVPTQNWLEGQWSDINGWPTSVCFHEGRLWWFGQNGVWGSQSNNYTGFASQDTDGTALGDSGAIIEQLGSGDADVIPWGLSLLRLLIGRERSIGSARSSSFDEPMTPTAFSVKDCSTNGAARLQAIKVDQKGIFVQQSGRRVYLLEFNGQAFDYVAKDLTRLNLDIGKPGFVAIAAQRQPDMTVHLVRSDGQVACLLFDEDDDVTCWTRTMTMGVIEDVAVLPSATEIEDRVYYVVKRVINGQTRRFIEKLALRDECVGGLLNKQLDCAFVYSSDTPVLPTSVAAPWLGNTSVMVWADGQVYGPVTLDAGGSIPSAFAIPAVPYHNIVIGLAGDVIVGTTRGFIRDDVAPDQVFPGSSNTLTVPTAYNGVAVEVFGDIGGTGHIKYIGALVVSNGLVTLPNGNVATTIVACCGYVAPFMSSKLAYAAQLGTAINQKKKIAQVGLTLFDTASQWPKAGQRFDMLDPMPAVEAGQATPGNTVWQEYDEPMFPVSGEWDSDARLCLLAQAPYPCTVGAVVIGLTTNEKA